MVSTPSQVYYDVGFSENVNYCTYLKEICFKNLLQSEVLFFEGIGGNGTNLYNKVRPK